MGYCNQERINIAAEKPFSGSAIDRYVCNNDNNNNNNNDNDNDNDNNNNKHIYTG